MGHRLWADFNDLNGDSIVTVLPKSGVADLAPGQAVELWDYEGNVCQGYVQTTDGPRVMVRIDQSTWEPAPAGKSRIESDKAGT